MGKDCAEPEEDMKTQKEKLKEEKKTKKNSKREEARKLYKEREGEFNKKQFEQFKFYYADNFFKDEQGIVEVIKDEVLVETQFRIPPHVKLLTKITRDSIS